MANTLSGSIGPFEEAKISALNMVAKIQEAVVIQKLLEYPTDDNLEILCQFLFTDPRFLDSEDLPN